MMKKSMDDEVLRQKIIALLKDFGSSSSDSDLNNAVMNMLKILPPPVIKLKAENSLPVSFIFCDITNYFDTAPMMSFSGILISPDRIDDLTCELKNHEFFSPDKIQTINMPSFSPIERYFIDKNLPSNDMDCLFNSLGYPLIPKETASFDETKNLLKLYAKFWHKYPDFVRVIP